MAEEIEGNGSGSPKAGRGATVSTRGQGESGVARRRGQHAGLRPESIVRTAIAIADEEGLAAVSMRRIGAELKVEAMALYHYFPNKGALLDAVVEELSTSAPSLDIADSPWQEAVKSYARAQLTALSEHPNLVELVMNRPAVTAGNLALLETLVDFLCTAGFSARRGLDMIYTVHELVLMHAALGGELRQAAHLDGIPETDFPRLVEAAGAASHRHPTARFEFALDALIAGFAEGCECDS